MATTYEGWDTISAGMTEREAVEDCRRRGITFQEFAEEVSANWSKMFPNVDAPTGLVEGIARELEAAASA